MGILPVRYRMGERLRRLGYSEVEAASGLFAGVPGPLRGHLFHYTTLVEDVPMEGVGQLGLPGQNERIQGESGEGRGGGSGGKEIPASSQRGPLAESFLTLSEPAFRHTEDGRPEGFSQGGVVASYMHAFFPSNPLYAARLAERLRS